MSEATTQKYLVAITCLFGLVVLLIGYGRRRDQSFERLPLESDSAVVSRLATPISPRDQSTVIRSFISKANQNSSPWQSLAQGQSIPAANRAASTANFGATRQLPVRDSIYNQQRPVENYFNSSTKLQSSAPSRPTVQHPMAQKLAERDHQTQQIGNQLRQRNRQVQQQISPAAPQPTNRQVSQTRHAPQFHDFGNVGQAAATLPISTENSNVRQALVDSRIPEPDLFTEHNQMSGNTPSPATKAGSRGWSTNQFVETKDTQQKEVTRSVLQHSPETIQHEIAAKIPATEDSQSRNDRGIRKTNWTEIEATPNIDPMVHYHPLQQPVLPQLHANAQVEARVRAQVQYGQSLARRRAYFAAREEFTRALLLIASSYNSESNSTVYPERLAQGLIAIDELGDFERANGSLLHQKILSHKSRLLEPQDITTISQVQAIGLYSSFAQSQIVQAIGYSAAGSEALHALGKLESMVPEADSNQIKKLIFYRAAIHVNPSNAVCANDLGVLLFDMGRLEESEAALIAAVGSAQSELTWNNLALVHGQRAATAKSSSERNRQLSLAKLAAQQAERFATHSVNAPINDRLSSRQWATPNDFQNNAAFSDVVVQQTDSRSPQNTSQPDASRTATLKQKMKDWF